MKSTHLWLFALICVAVSHCTKSDLAPQKTLSPFYVDSAVYRLKELLPMDHFRKLNIASPEPVEWEGNMMAICFYEEGSERKRFVLLQKTDGEFTGTAVDLTGLQATGEKRISGPVTVMDLVTKSLQQYRVENNRITDIQAPQDASAVMKKSPSDHQTSISSPDNPQKIDEFIVYGYMSSTQFFSMYWLMGQSPAFIHLYIPEEAYGSGTYAGSNASSAIAIPVVDSPDHPIQIQEEFKCFTLNPKSVYTVTVNVNQPFANTRSLVNPLVNHNVGHAYLTLQELQPDGNSVVRNIGFYPKGSARIGRTVDKSSFGDDSNTPNSVALKISVNLNEFITVMNTLRDQENYQYDLNNFNCTNSALSALSSINISLPKTFKSSMFFHGYNPADLGQDIRELILKEFSSQNQGRKVVRTISDKNNHTPMERQGEC